MSTATAQIPLPWLTWNEVGAQRKATSDRQVGLPGDQALAESAICSFPFLRPHAVLLPQAVLLTAVRLQKKGDFCLSRRHVASPPSCCLANGSDFPSRSGGPPTAGPEPG